MNRPEHAMQRTAPRVTAGCFWPAPFSSRAAAAPCSAVAELVVVDMAT